MRTKPCLTAKDVGRIVAACREVAAAQSWAVTIVVTDDAGRPMHLERLDARASTVDVALGKARTAALMCMPTADLEKRVLAVPTLMALDAMPLRGGLPLQVGADFVGAIGVSGVTAEQDEQVAAAGVAMLARIVAGA